MNPINPAGNVPIEPLEGVESKQEEKTHVLHPFNANSKIQMVAEAALKGIAEVPQIQEIDSSFFDYTSSGVETVEEYLSISLQRIRTYLVEKGHLRENPQIGKNVMLLLTPLAGFGDILFICKAAQALKAEGFNPIIRVVRAGKKDPLEVKEKLEKMANMENIQILTSDSEQGLKPDCVIIAPTIPEEEIIDRVVKPLAVPFEKIYEYGGNKNFEERNNVIFKYRLMNTFQQDFGRSWSGFKPLDIDRCMNDLPIMSGMGAAELGVFVEKGLIKPLSKEKKAEKLNVIGKNDPKKFDLIFQGKSGQEYLDSTHLFFGYAHQEGSMKKFVDTIALLKQKETLDIDVILPWRLIDLDTTFEFYKKCEYNESTLKEAGIGRVEIINSDGKFSKNISQDGSGKVLRIINLFQFTNHQIRDLLAVSEAPVLVTGDQSLNEAILFSKIPLYEKMEWKGSLVETMEKKSKPYPLVSAVLSDWFSNREEELKESILLCSQESFEGSQMESFHKSIINPNNSLEKNLCNEALRLSALGKSPEFKVESERLENKIKEVFKIPLFLEIITGAFRTQIIYKNMIEKEVLNSLISQFYELDKTDLPKEVVEPIVQLINMIDEPKSLSNIAKASEIEEKQAKLLLEMILEKLKNIKI